MIPGPNDPSVLPLVATQVDATSFGAAALDDRGQVWLWGDHFRSVSDVPILSPLEVPVAGVATSSGFSCALDAAGRVWCWGSNRHRQLGLEDVEESMDPLQIPLVEPAMQVDTSAVTACAIVRSGGVVCWGSNAGGALGTDPAALEGSAEPLSIEIPDATQGIELDFGAGCAVTELGRVYCWGSNRSFRFAPEEEDPQSGVVELPELEGASRVALAEYEVCALIDGGVKCRVAERNLPRRAIWLEFDDE